VECSWAKNIILSNIFPLQLPAWHVAIALSSNDLFTPIKLVLVDEAGDELGFVGFSSESNHDNVILSKETPSATNVLVVPDCWTLFFLPLGNTGIAIKRPGNVQFRVNSVRGEVVGQLTFILVEPPALTSERIAALRSDPLATKAARVVYSCAVCGTDVRAYVALEHDQALESEGWQWYSNFPEKFICECGRNVFELDIARRNLHALLGAQAVKSDRVEFIPLYEQTALATLRASYSNLIKRDPKEEDIQKFLEANPVLLHPFPALRLFNKPPILTHFFADFAIVTPQKELVLVEIEKTTTRLLKKDGGMAADLGHAFDQVQSWLHVLDEHRVAVLDSLRIERNEVSTVRGVVIAGRDLGYDSLHLRRLKGRDFGRTSFMTYDDLLLSLDSLIGKMRKL